MFTLDDIKRMTKADGEQWGYPHVQRVLTLVDCISGAVPHDAELLTWAVVLHDWGAFPKYRQHGVPHALRSRQIVEADIAPHTHFTAPQIAVLLETIERHDYQDQRPVQSNEALLLREADWLDMLGAIGIIREFAWGPNDLQVCQDRVLKHRDMIQGRFTIPTAQQIAAQRIARMNVILSHIADESFGCL